MKIEYRVVTQGEQIVEEQYFEEICCDEMKKAMLVGESPFANKDVKCLWLFCPFCKAGIEY